MGLGEKGEEIKSKKKKNQTTPKNNLIDTKYSGAQRGRHVGEVGERKEAGLRAGITQYSVQMMYFSEFYS